MRSKGCSSASKGKNGGIQGNDTKEEPQLSGAYIRSLVKQLTSSTTTLQNPTCNLQKPQTMAPLQQKRQVRRRLHTAKPYQDGLLNIAQARREIVTALKFHRAAMKQKQRGMESGIIHPVQPSSHEFEQQSRRNSRIYASNSAINPNNDCPSQYRDSFCNSTGFCPHSWPISSMPAPHVVGRNSSFPLPAQTLGLNLNHEHFTNLDPNSLISSSSSNSATAGKVPLLGTAAIDYGNSVLHPVKDDKEMAEIRSIGEQYQMEWNDMVNSANSAWWFEFLKAMEIEPENPKGLDYKVMELPGWLNANDGSGSCFQCVNDDYFEDPALSCMELEKIEGMDDGDWLA